MTEEEIVKKLVTETITNIFERSPKVSVTLSILENIVSSICFNLVDDLPGIKTEEVIDMVCKLAKEKLYILEKIKSGEPDKRGAALDIQHLSSTKIN